jgi:hypothetical protein
MLANTHHMIAIKSSLTFPHIFVLGCSLHVNSCYPRMARKSCNIWSIARVVQQYNSGHSLPSFQEGLFSMHSLPSVLSIQDKMGYSAFTQDLPHCLDSNVYKGTVVVEFR